jgi:hypothetical protein
MKDFIFMVKTKTFSKQSAVPNPSSQQTAAATTAISSNATQSKN